MIMNIAKKSLVLALLAGIGFSAVAQERVYAIDQRGAVVKSGFGLCWRDGYWTPAAAAKDAAGCECDKDLLPADTCVAKVAAQATPTTPPVGPKPDNTKITVAADALFDFNKAVLRPEGKAKLDDVVAKSKAIKLEVILA
ncbi:MAG: OmpA family protein, partial [Azonexus sp.]